MFTARRLLTLTATGARAVSRHETQNEQLALGIALVAPDTSPRLPDDRKLPGEDDSYDFGSGAGFYVDATNYPGASTTTCIPS